MAKKNKDEKILKELRAMRRREKERAIAELKLAKTNVIVELIIAIASIIFLLFVLYLFL